MKKYIQALSLLFFTLLFFLATYQLPSWVIADLYLRLDPLLGLSTAVAGREISVLLLWSLPVMVVTILAGRFFCGYFCPLGASIDGLDVLVKPLRNPSRSSRRYFRHGKYLLLVSLFAAAVAGVSLVYLADPMAILTRTYTFVLYPLLASVFNLLLALIRPVADYLGAVSLARYHYPQPLFYMTGLTFLIFGGIILLNRWTPRFWCRYLCPLGALLGLVVSPWRMFRRRVTRECNQCLACQANCPMGAIEEDPSLTRERECIQCRRCARICPRQAVLFPLADVPAGQGDPVDLSRRGLIYSAAGGFSLAFVTLQSPYRPLQGKKQLIRPPGAIPEEYFLQVCVRCGKCMKACITKTIQPCFWEAGLAGLWSPKLQLRLAPCEPNCHVCGQVCPTQAIRELSLEEKTHAKVGNAVLWQDKCVVWTQNRPCLICDEICPFNAIVFRSVNGFRRPFVIASRCNGCGYCETACPVRGESAIVIVPDGEIRLKTGSYIREAQRLNLEFRPDPGDDQLIFDKPKF